MSNLSRGKYAQAISDQSGMAFPDREMVTQWDGLFVHYTEVDPKQPQLNPRPHQADGQGLPKARPARTEPPVLVLLAPNPFQTIINSGTTYINVSSPNHGRATGDIVRFRGSPAQNPTAGSGGPDENNLYFFNPVPSFDAVTDIDNENGFTITVGRISSTDIDTDEYIQNNFFFFQSADTATTGNQQGGDAACSAGPVTLEA